MILEAVDVDVFLDVVEVFVVVVDVFVEDFRLVDEDFDRGLEVVVDVVPIFEVECVVGVVGGLDADLVDVW